MGKEVIFITTRMELTISSMRNKRFSCFLVLVCGLLLCQPSICQDVVTKPDVCNCNRVVKDINMVVSHFKRDSLTLRICPPHLVETNKHDKLIISKSFLPKRIEIKTGIVTQISLDSPVFQIDFEAMMKYWSWVDLNCSKIDSSKLLRLTVSEYENICCQIR